MSPVRRADIPIDYTRPVRILWRQSSTDAEDLGDDGLSQSLRAQERDLRAFVRDTLKVPVLSVTHEFNTKGWQDREARENLQRELQACIASGNNLVVWELSRLVRRLRLQEEIFEELAPHGLTIFSRNEQWTYDPMMRQVMGAFNEQRTREIARWLRSSIKSRAQDGIHHANPPYGYIRTAKDGPLAPHPPVEKHGRLHDVAGIPGRVWTWYGIDGLGYGRIASRLEAEGAPSMIDVYGRRNGVDRWTKSSIQKMITNPAYLGHVILHGEIVHADAHPALCTQDLFEAVQRRLAKNTRNRGDRDDASWLYGMVRCICGAGSTLKKGKRRGPNARDAHFFHCNERSKGLLCSAPSPHAVVSHKIEQGVVDVLLDLMKTAPDWAAAYRRAQDRDRANGPSRDERRQQLDRAIADAESERAQMLRLVRRQLLEEERWYAEDQGLMRSIAALRAELAGLAPPITPEPYLAAAALVEAFRDDVVRLANVDPSALRPIINTLGATPLIQEPYLLLPIELEDLRLAAFR